MARNNLRGNKRIVPKDFKIKIPCGMGLNADDVIEFNLLDDGSIVIHKLLHPMDLIEAKEQQQISEGVNV